MSDTFACFSNKSVASVAFIQWIATLKTGTIRLTTQVVDDLNDRFIKSENYIHYLENNNVDEK